MKDLMQFIYESLNEAYKYNVDFNDVSAENLDKYNDLKASVGIRRENQLPTEKQFNQMIEKIIKDEDKDFAQAFLQLFMYEYAQDETMKRLGVPEFEPDLIFVLGNMAKKYTDYKYAIDPTPYLKNRKDAESLQKSSVSLDQAFGKFLQKYNIKHAVDFPDYRNDTIKLCKHFNIDSKVTNN